MSFNSFDSNSLAIVPYVGQCHAAKLHSYVQESLKLRMQSIINSSFMAQLSDYNYFHQYRKMGDIVVLVGTSTAGKSSIIKALKQLESDRLEDGVDLRCYALDLKKLKKYCPNEIEVLENLMRASLDIPKAVFASERFWKTGISPQEIMEGEKAIQSAIQLLKKTRDSFSPKELEEWRAFYRNMEINMFDDAFEYSRCGVNIIFDVLNIDILARHILARNFNGPIRAVLTYCPFHVLSSRMEKRNKEAVKSGELSNRRIGEFPLMQFGNIYTRKEEGQRAFERLSREQVTKAFDENFDKGIREHESSSPARLMAKESLRADLLRNLGFTEGVDVVDIVPKNRSFYHLILNSSQLLPEESANIIHHRTYERWLNRLESSS